MSEQRLSPGSYIGPFKIISLIGKGGMGEVYEAQEESLGRKVALKIISTSSSNNERILNQFISEARALAQLNHKNVVTIYRLGQDHAEGEYYIAMEFIEGNTLSDGIKGKKYQFKDMVAIIRQIISGLKAVHAANIIHRDLKPKNIIIQSNNQVKIVDFGVAEALMGGTGSAEAVGTINYLAPEVLAGEPSSRQSDIWSAGIIFYELFTGMSPFRSNTEDGIREEVKTLSLIWPVGTKVWLPEDLKKVVMRMCAHDLAERYQTIEEVYDDLLKISSGKKIDGNTKTIKPTKGGLFGSKSFKTESPKSQVKTNPLITKPSSNKRVENNKKLKTQTAVTSNKSYLLNNKSIKGGENVYDEFEKIKESPRYTSYIILASVLMATVFGINYLGIDILKKQVQGSVKKIAGIVYSNLSDTQEVVSNPETLEKPEARDDIPKVKAVIAVDNIVVEKAKILNKKIKSILNYGQINDIENLVEVEKALQNPVEISWTEVSGADKYELHISKTKTFDSSITYLSLKNKFVWVSAKPGKYYFKVKVIKDKQESDFSEIGVAELFMQAPALQSKYLETVFASKRKSVQVKIEWPALPYVFGYSIIVSKTNNFSKTLVKENVSQNFANLQVNPDTNYYIKVATIDAQGKLLSSYSVGSLVRVKLNSQLDAPLGNTPRNLSSISNKPSPLNPLVLTWKPVSGAERYELQVSKSKNFNNTILSSKIETTSFSISNPLPKGRVFWRVRAINGNVRSNWSRPFSVSVP
ncbi:MAG: serine/threonine protein kinase [Bdellovibrionales bacterium]|nr:serine/threonine protein kinase [Bdellovibrionales bacterium]